jgi:hypothetical protein
VPCSTGAASSVGRWARRRGAQNGGWRARVRGVQLAELGVELICSRSRARDGGHGGPLGPETAGVGQAAEVRSRAQVALCGFLANCFSRACCGVLSAPGLR